MFAIFAELFNAAVELVKAKRSGGKANNRPRTVTRRQPRLNPLLARGFSIAEWESDLQRTRSRGRLKLNIGNAIFANDMPNRPSAFKARKLTCGLRIGFDCGGIRRRHFEITNDAVVHGATITIRHPHGDHRARNAIGNKP